MPVEVHHEPADVPFRSEIEDCTKCRKSTRYWLTPHIPLCPGCAKNMTEEEAERLKNNAGYFPFLKISYSYTTQMPNNCAVLTYTADGHCMGTCMYHLADGRMCPLHGKVKI